MEALFSCSFSHLSSFFLSFFLSIFFLFFAPKKLPSRATRDKK
jgi:hypothetical protein